MAVVCGAAGRAPGRALAACPSEQAGTLARDTCLVVPALLVLLLLTLSHLRATGAAGVLFFWSFEILVFLVLLNFLLAIIVDAFGDIKGGC